jgi:hypothetical protein
MVKLINWKKAPREERIKAKRLLREEGYDVYIILLQNRKFVEYFKSHDLDSGEKLLIRKERKGNVMKEIKRLREEEFSIKLVIFSL